MHLGELSLQDFDNVFTSPPSVYDSARFNLLNAAKADALKAVALFDSDDHPIVGQIFGQKDGIWRAPFSAPFSSPSFIGGHRAEIPEFYRILPEFLNGPVRLVLPPELYAPYVPEGDAVIDTNHHYPLSRLADFEAHLTRDGRYNHHRAAKHPFELIETADIPRAYSIIAANRAAMGYPLAMSLAQVLGTIKIIPAHFFILTLDGRDAAAAMVYRVTTSTAQVIYWGDLPEFRPCRAMNALAFKLFSWYAAHEPEVKVIDIGPSSSGGILSPGLAHFKESIGCLSTPKHTIQLANFY